MNRGFGFGLLLWFLTLIVLAFVTAQNGYGSAETSAPALLPSGFLSVKGAQIISSQK